MRVILILMMFILVGSTKIFGQNYNLYSNNTLLFESQYLGEAIQLNIHLPETYPFSAQSTKYPITVVFDSQHERTYPHIINSFDLLTSETQIPESIIIGVPFTMQNRRYFTSVQKHDNDTISGIERLESFLFSELIPKLQEEYKGSKFISLIGHSRTAFLVNYLSYNRPSEVNLAISLSGFFNNEPLSTKLFYEFLTDPTHFPNKFSYYYTAGTSREESTYLEQFENLDSLLAKNPIPRNVNIVFNKTRNANHMSNYWVSIPTILMDAFSSYNSILNLWFYDKTKAERSINPIKQFEIDLEQAGKSLGTPLNPNLTHIFSLASLYANKEDYETAIKFFELGLEYFPNYLDFYVEIIECYKVLDNTEQITIYKTLLRKKTVKNQTLNATEKQEIFEYLDNK